MIWSKNGYLFYHSSLPAQRQLALTLGVNRSTLQEAIDELKADGILSSKVGSSTYVSNDSWSMLLKQKQPNWQKYIEASIHKPNFQTIQLINEFEQDESIIRLSTGELAPSLLPFHFLLSLIPVVRQNVICPLVFSLDQSHSFASPIYFLLP